MRRRNAAGGGGLGGALVEWDLQSVAVAVLLKGGEFFLGVVFADEGGKVVKWLQSTALK
jgi:hypothetical protein